MPDLVAAPEDAEAPIPEIAREALGLIGAWCRSNGAARTYPPRLSPKAKPRHAVGGTLIQPSGEYGGRVKVARESGGLGSVDLSKVDIKREIETTLRQHGFEPDGKVPVRRAEPEEPPDVTYGDEWLS